MGVKHSAVITADGDLYTFGNGNWGILGHGNESNKSYQEPTLVEWFKKHNIKLKDIVLGEYHSLALDTEGNVYSWGYGGKKGLFNWMYS